MDIDNSVKETAKGGWMFIKSILLLGVPFMAFNIILGLTWAIINISDVEAGFWSSSYTEVYAIVGMRILEYWPVWLPFLFFMVLMPLLYFKNAYAYGLRKVIAFVLGHAKAPLCEYLGELIFEFISNNKTIMKLGSKNGPAIQKEWMYFLRKKRKVKSKPLRMAMDYVLDKLVIIDFLERVKLGTFDIESKNTQRLLLDEMEDFVDVQIIERFVEPDMNGIYKVLGINVVLIIVQVLLT